MCIIYTYLIKSFSSDKKPFVPSLQSEAALNDRPPCDREGGNVKNRLFSLVDELVVIGEADLKSPK